MVSEIMFAPYLKRLSLLGALGFAVSAATGLSVNMAPQWTSVIFGISASVLLYFYVFFSRFPCVVLSPDKLIVAKTIFLKIDVNRTNIKVIRIENKRITFSFIGNSKTIITPSLIASKEYSRLIAEIRQRFPDFIEQ